ncbi:MAG: transcriptional regulator NrdR [Myxococcaceae bacterium]
MKCPFCQAPENKVLDSRESQEGVVTRRRRECLSCSQRFTTYERVEELTPLVVKKDGRREAFDREKLLAGLKKACEKRPVSVDQLEDVVTQVERRLQQSGEREVSASAVGKHLMELLRGLDEVAYVRFASVYRSFRDISEFMTELQELLAHAAPPSKEKKPKG